MAVDRSTRVEVRALRAMGCDVELILVGSTQDVMDEAVAEIHRLERLWSRFLPDSEVSQLNRLAGQALRVDPATMLLVERSVAAWRLSGGGFDPTVLGAMLRAGYSAPLEVDGHGEHAPVASDLVVGCSDIVVDPVASTVTIPPASGFDPGGIGKGLAADIVATRVLAAGAGGVCVNLGGDLRIEGVAPAGGSWCIGVDHPDGTPVALLSIEGGAVATSTTLRRRWTVGGSPRHHLIDPHTGEPAVTDVELMTVVAGQAWRAEALATASLIRGRAGVFDLLDDRVAGLAVMADGSVLTTDALRPYLAPLHRSAA